MARPFSGTFTFTSTVPVAVFVVRAMVNERSELLMTTLPVVTAAPPPDAGLVVPHYAYGDGWTTQLILVNPGEQPLNGMVQFIEHTGTSSLPYSIAPRGQQLVERPGTQGEIHVGYVSVTSGQGTQAPSAMAIVSLRSGGVTISQTAIPAVLPGAGFKFYAESTDRFDLGRSGSIQTAMAIANTRTVPAAIQLELMRADGSVAATASRVLPGKGHLSLFLHQIPEFNILALPAQGVLRVRSDAGGISAMGFRARYNERGDFIIASLPSANEGDSLSSRDRIFPQILSGGGATSEVILFNPAQNSTSGFLRLYSPRGEPLGANLRPLVSDSNAAPGETW
jgi:hypothetical protein